MRIQKILRFSVLTLPFLLFCTDAQSQVPAPALSDEQLLQMKLDQFEQLIRAGNAKVASFIFAKDAESRKTDLKLTQTLTKSDLSTFYIESKNLTVQNDVAYLFCDIHCVGLERALTDNVIFAKTNGRWEITSSNVLLPLCRSAVSQLKTGSTKKDGEPSQLNPVSVTYSNKVLIPRNVPWITPFKLTRTHVQNQLGVWLLGSPVDVDLKMYAWPNDAVGFFLDRMWDRIIIGKRINRWIGSYGDHPEDYVIHRPTSLAYGDGVIGAGWIYVTVPYSGELLRLLYNHQNQTVTLAQRLIDPALPTPSDVYYDYGVPENPSDDLIWVADENSNKIVMLDKFLGILSVFDSYIDNSGNTVPIFRPKKVIGRSKGHSFLQAWITYISWYNTLITLFYNYPDPPILVSSSTFSYTSRLSGLGLEYPGGYIDYPGGGFIVSDEGLNCVHKFDSEGNYICSFRTNSGNNSLFVSPKLVTSSGSNALPGTAFLDIGVMDVWGPTTGLQDFFPGADAINISIDRTGNTFSFRWTFTNAVQESVLIVTESGAFVETLLPTGGRPGPGSFIRTRESSQLPYANLKLRIKVKPAYNSDYGNYVQDWVIREVPFSNPLFAPTISGFTQNPIPIYQGEYGTVTCNLSQGNGNITYSWIERNIPPGVTITYQNGRAYISYDYSALARHDGRSIMKIDDERQRPEAELECTASNASGSSTGLTTVRLATRRPSGCPFVYSYNGEVFVEDNNILPQSQFTENQGRDVTDYYQLFCTPSLEEDRYKIAIGEFEQEHSFLDQLRLLVVDHDPLTSITVDDSGTVVQFAKPALFLDALLDSEQVIKKLSQLDSVKVEVTENDTMKLLFTNDGSAYEQGLLLIGQAIRKEMIAGNLMQHDPRQQATFTSFRFRRNPSYTWVLVPAADTSTQQIDIQWKQDAAVDYTELSRRLENPFTVQEATLAIAEHSTNGDVTAKLLNQDEDYTELQPGVWINLEFAAPALAGGMERSFVFVSRGRYDTLSANAANSQLRNLASAPHGPEQSLPTQYSISQNYPNPFNPGTKIRFALPEPTNVRILVYDLLGRVVKTLIDDYYPGGYHEISWDGTNEKGSSVGSGLYVYRLVTPHHTEARRMLLLK